MKKILTITLLLVSTAQFAQLNFYWANVHNGIGDYSDKIKASTIDNSGNIYLAGFTMTLNHHDMLVIKLNASGDTLWTRTHNGFNNSEDEANDVAVDALGNVYVTGYANNDSSNEDFVTLKYNSSGNLLWIATFNDPFGDDDEANSIALDGSGNVYVTGTTTKNTDKTNEDYRTIKYNSSGVQQWATAFAGPGGGTDRAVKVVVDASGNPIVTGRSDNGEDDDWVTIKYNTNTGAALWTNFLDYTKNDRPETMTIDASGNVYITGRAKDINYDVATRKIDANGNTLWTKFYAGAGDDRGRAIAVDASGNVYIAGEIDLNASSVVDLFDIFTIKYNSAGTQLWAKTYNGAGSGDDVANALTVTNSGEVIVVGSTDAATGATIDLDYITIKYDAAGNVVYTKTAPTVGNDDEATCVVHNGNGVVTISGGLSSILLNKNAVTIQYDSLGNQLFSKSFDGFGDNRDAGNKLWADGLGHVYVVGYSTELNEDRNILLLKIDATGNTVWNKKITGTSGVNTDEGLAIAGDGNGNVVIGGTIKESGFSNNYFIAKLNTAGDTLWTQQYDYNSGSDRLVDLAVDNSGNIIATGRSDQDANAQTTNFDVVTLKYNSNGDLQNTMIYNSAVADTDEPYDLVVSTAGNVYVAARVTTGTNDDMLLLKYNTSGIQQWAKRYDKGKDDRNEALIIDASENIYVCGRTELNNNTFDAILLKYNSNGDTLWTKTWNGSGNKDDRFDALTFDASGNVVTVGRTDPDGNGLNYDFLIAKYAANGNLLWDTTWTNTATSDDVAVAVTTDNLDRIYVIGESNYGTVANPNYDYVTMQLDASGNILDIATYDYFSANDKPRAILVSGTSVYITGAGDGIGTMNDVITLRYDLISGIKNPINDPLHLTAYPNPFSDVINIALPRASTANRLTITNTLGQVIKSITLDNETELHVNSKEWAKGIYFISLINHEGHSIAKTKIVAQ
jgi:uncharacterized delta-60 repeat protein